MHTSEKIGLIAGQGQIPEMLLKAWERAGLSPVIVGLDGITDQALLTGRCGAFFSIGQVGHIFDFLRSHQVKRVVMIGAMRRPNFWTLRTDAVGLRIILSLLLRRMGDDSLLKFIRAQFEKRGISVVGAHEFLPDILASAGAMGSVVPDDVTLSRIRNGFRAAKRHGADDKGQSIVIGECGQILLETESGTNALIKLASGLKRAILVKVSKPQQDLALDMPTIGPETVRQAIAVGIIGIAVEAGKTMLVDRQDVVRLCNDAGLFLLGIEESQLG